MKKIKEINNLSLRELEANSEPVVVRNYNHNWPVVKSSLVSDKSAINYTKKFCRSADVDTLIIPPNEAGKIFYNETMDGYNFEYRKAPLSAILDQILSPHKVNTIVAQSAPIPECLPGFEKQNSLAILNDKIIPRIWLGNSCIVPTHYDDSHNIACVVSGKRTFTLFPPEQISNLYIGPLDFAPTGAAISLVDLHQPDNKKFPKFKNALREARSAELSPGDIIYIPPLWWHHVESTSQLNMLVNYWWGGSIEIESNVQSPYDCLLHSLVNIAGLPDSQKSAWKHYFDYYVFGTKKNRFEHIPAKKRGILSELSDKQKDSISRWLINQLKKNLVNTNNQ